MLGRIASHRPLALRVGLCLLLVLAATGCGSDDNDDGLPGDPITCEWFTGANCWRATATEFGACSSDSQGAFDASATSCTSEDGGQVSFDSPVPAEIDADYPWDFTVANNGTPCGRFQSIGDGFVLTTPSGDVRAAANIAGEVITCPDGSKYSIPMSDAFECLFDLPGIGWSESSSTLSVNLVGGDDNSIFECTR